MFASTRFLADTRLVFCPHDIEFSYLKTPIVACRFAPTCSLVSFGCVFASRVVVFGWLNIFSVHEKKLKLVCYLQFESRRERKAP
jgi:hypothetical protein